MALKKVLSPKAGQGGQILKSEAYVQVRRDNEVEAQSPSEQD
jgi:hypothetical protein